MNRTLDSVLRAVVRHTRILPLVTASVALGLLLCRGAAGQSTFAGNAQHTAIYSPMAQYLNTVHWTAPIDMNTTGGYAHYGAPLITPANTAFVPVKTGAAGGFQINAFTAGTGAKLYNLTTDYILPSYEWIPVYQPVLATNSTETRLYYAGAGGTVYYINNVDSASHGAPVQQVFYTTLAGYQANSSNFNSTVFINTPVTADSAGNIFFGFRVSGTAPAPLSTAQSGFARIDPNGNATYVLAGTAAGDASIGYDTHNAAPALSNDQSTLYVPVKSPTNEGYAYLLGLDSTTLATKYKTFLYDPRSNNANSATVLDLSTASPLVAPDGDVYFGIYGNPSNGSRGFLLHFSGDLTVEKPAGGFGWDNTPGIVPVSMVPSYNGAASYLLLCKYNNYANAGGDSGDGINRIALLDPTSTEIDAHPSSNGMAIMREVFTIIGPSADASSQSSSLPYAVREWCINSPAINPASNGVYIPSEDGNLYRWNLVTNSLDQFIHLTPGLGEPYVPTIIGPDGQVYTLNGGTMSAAGSVSGVGVSITSSAPDVRKTVVGQSITFTIKVTNTSKSGTIPTGSINLVDTLLDVSNGSLNTTTTTLVSNLALDSNGNATYTTSALKFHQHFITAAYSGDSNFNPSTAGLVQNVHANATTTTVTSLPNIAVFGQPVTFTATVSGVPSGAQVPTGQVTFSIGSIVLAQVPVNSSGAASFKVPSLALGANSITATYASDTVFAASSGSKVQLVSGDTTISTVTSYPNPSVFGQAVTFTATVTAAAPGSGTVSGTVTFRAGNVQLDTLPLNSEGQANFTTSALPLGASLITVTYNGTADFIGSTSQHVTQSVTRATTATSLTSSANPSVFGQSVTYKATVTTIAPGSGTPVGVVTFKNGATSLKDVTLDSSGHASYTISNLLVGSPVITAVYNGGGGYIGSVGSVNQIVNSAATVSSEVSSGQPSVFGQTVTFTATVKAVVPGSGVPAGTVTFMSGTVALGTANLNGTGVATFASSKLPTGSSSISVVYSGSASFLSSTSQSRTQTVNKDATSTAVTSSINPSDIGQSVTLTVTVKSSAPGSGIPTGSIIIKDGNTILATETLNSSGSYSYATAALAKGAHSITVVYSGDSNDAGSTSQALTQMVK